MKKTKMEKGITLIALIITIVVLLILAMITIGTIKNSSIIENSQKASDDYTTAQEKEQIQLALGEWQLQKNTQGNTQTFKSVMESELSSSATVGGKDDGPVTITFTKTGNVYKITNDGNTTSFGKVTSLEKYIFGRNLDGQTEMYFFEDAEGNIKNVANEELGIEEGSVSIINVYEDIKESYSIGKNCYDYYYYFIEYKDVAYKFKLLNKWHENDDYESTNTILVDYGLIEVYRQEEGTKVGKKVSYDNKLWTILYDDNEKGLQMICDNVLLYNNNEFTIGTNDSLIDWNTVTTDAELNSYNGLGKFIYSYNKAIETLNTACEKIVTANQNIIDVRCVGSNPTNKNAENTTLFTSENLAKWPINRDPGILNNKAYSSDDNYLFDYERMLVLGITKGYDVNNTECEYWVASRWSYDRNCIYFRILAIDESGSICKPYMFELQKGGFVSGTSRSVSNYLRPVVKLKSDVQFSGSGTETDPYIFAE